MKSLISNIAIWPALASSKRAVDRGDQCCGGTHAGIVHNDNEHGLSARKDQLQHLQQHLLKLKEQEEAERLRKLEEEREREARQKAMFDAEQERLRIEREQQEAIQRLEEITRKEELDRIAKQQA